MTRNFSFVSFAFAIGIFLTPAIVAAEDSIAITVPQRRTPVDFATEVLPILRQNCIACHSDSADGELVLETPETIRNGGTRGPAVVEGKSSESLLLKMAAHQIKPVMPPVNNKVGAVSLTSSQLGLIKLWIDQGATGTVPEKPEVPRFRPLPPSVQPIFAVDITGDGQVAASSRADAVDLFDLRAGRLIATLRDPADGGESPRAHRGLVRSLAFSHDGKRLATGGYRTVKIWQRTPAHELLTWDLATSPTVAAVSPDGTQAALGSEDGGIRIVNLTDGKEEHLLTGHRQRVFEVVFSKDGSRLFSAAADKSVRLWSPSDGKSLGQLAVDVTSMDLLPNGSTFVTGSDDGMLRLWDLSSIQETTGDTPPVPISEWRAHSQSITVVAAISGTEHVVSGAKDNQVRRWNAATGEQLRTWYNDAAVGDIVAVPDGSRIISSGGSYARLHDGNADRTIIALKGDVGQLRQLEDMRGQLDFTRALVAYRRQDSRDAADRSKRQDDELKKGGEARNKAQTEMEKAVQAAEEPRKELARAEEAATVAMTARDEALVARDKVRIERDDAMAANAEDIEAKQAALKAAEELLREKEKDYQTAARMRNDVENKTRNVINAADKAIETLDVATKQLERLTQFAAHDVAAKETTQTEFEAVEAAEKEQDAAVKQRQQEVDQYRPEVRALTLSRDGTTLAVGMEDGTIQLYDAQTGAPIQAIVNHKSAITQLAFGADGDLLSIDADRHASYFRTRDVWRLERTIGSPHDSLTFTGRVLTVAFSPDDALLATGSGLPSRKGELKIWRVADGGLEQEFEQAHTDSVHGVAWSPDGRRLASAAADQLVRIWALDGPLDSDRLRKTLEGHTGYVLGIDWSADGKLLATCGVDQVVKLWDAETAEQIRTYSGNAYRIGPFRQPVTSVTFIGNSEHILCSCGDSTIRLLRTGSDRDIRVYQGSTSYVQSVAASADGVTIVAGDHAGVLRVWNGYNNGRLLQTYAPGAIRAEQSSGQ